MKKSAFIVTILMTCMISTSISFAQNKYDVTGMSEFKNIIANYDKNIAPNRQVVNYLNALVDYNDLIRLAKSGELDSEKSKFLMEKSNEFSKYLQFLMMQQLDKSITIAEMAYITGVVSSKKAQAATTSSEYQTEQEVLRGYATYRVWEYMRGPGKLPQIVNEQLDEFAKVKK